MNFHHYGLDNGLNLYVMPTQKFKTVMIKVFWQQNLDERATENALLGMVLKRGTKNNPTTRGLNRLLEGMYGAELDSRVIKKGERHILEFSLELVEDSLVGEPLLEQGLKLMREVMLEPLLVEKGFSPDFLAQEKEQLKQIIEGIFNDKVTYSLERCIEEMGRGEPFGLSRYGKVEDFDRINPVNLYEHYLNRLGSVPMDIFVVGNIDAEQVFASAKKIFDFPRKGAYQLAPMEVKANPAKVKEIVEKQEINQGKLCLAFRTNIGYADAAYPALLVYNGILGGFAHSKLFQNVREKASLAYYASSRLEKSKGVLVIASGIEFKNYTQARRIIEEQVGEMSQGKITDTELENTKKGLINNLRASEDNYHLMTDMALEGLINNYQRDYLTLSKQIEQVSREELLEVSKGIQLDTVYFLTNREGSGLDG